MSERSSVDDHEITQSDAPDADWYAVILELTPFMAIPVWMFASNAGANLIYMSGVLVLAASGLGWWRIGRRGHAIAFAVTRGLLLVVFGGLAVGFFGFALGCEFEESDCGQGAGIFFGFLISILGLLVTAFVVPIVSAICVALSCTKGRIAP